MTHIVNACKKTKNEEKKKEVQLKVVKIDMKHEKWNNHLFVHHATD
jgi:hypothetical protein